MCVCMREKTRESLDFENPIDFRCTEEGREKRRSAEKDMEFSVVGLGRALHIGSLDHYGDVLGRDALGYEQIADRVVLSLH